MDERRADREGKAPKQKSYKALEEDIRRKDTENEVLRRQNKQMIAINPQTQAFEYIGAPVYLDVSTGEKENSLYTIDKVVNAAKIWLKRPSNDRLTITSAFSSFDNQGYGDIT
jgi:hypothetical protein